MTTTPDVWIKSRRCESGACVEVANRGDSIALRNSTDPDGPTIEFTKELWAALLDGVQNGEFHLEETQSSVGDSS